MDDRGTSGNHRSKQSFSHEEDDYFAVSDRRNSRSKAQNHSQPKALEKVRSAFTSRSYANHGVRIAVVVLAPITANTRSVLAKETLRNDGMPIIAENATFVLIAQIVRKARAVRIVQIVRITQIAREALVVQIVQVVHKVQIA